MEKFYQYIPSKDLIWIIATLDMIAFDIIGVPGPHVTIFCLVLGLACTPDNIDRIISRLCVMAIATQVLWKWSGVIDPNYINPIFSMMLACLMLKLTWMEESQGKKLLSIYVVIPMMFILEYNHIMTLFHFSILYFYGRSFKQGCIAVGLLAVLSMDFITLPAGVLIFYLTTFLKINIKLPKLLKYSVFPLHLVLIKLIGG